MSNLFNLDNGFFSFMGKLWDLIVLSIVWLICCIPIFTIGPASCALYYSVVKVIRRERGYVLREYFHSFKDNFKVGSITTIILVVLAFVLYIDRQYITVLVEKNSKMAYVFSAGINAITIIAIAVTVYIFPILSRFTLKVVGLFKTSFFMSMRHLLTTIVLLILTGVCLLGVYIIYPLIFIVPSLYCLLCSLLIERIFKKYTPVPEETPEESGKDQWYLE